MKYMALFVVVFLLSACQSTLILRDSGYFEADKQATIEITEILEVSPNSARVFLQNGQVQYQGKLDLYDVNCEVEINTVSESPQIIEPGFFNILAITSEESPIVLSKPLKLAALTFVWDSDSSPVDIKRFYRFRLSAQRSGAKTQVRAVICRGAQSEPYQAELPTLEQMQHASGRYLRFNL